MTPQIHLTRLDTFKVAGTIDQRDGSPSVLFHSTTLHIHIPTAVARQLAVELIAEAQLAETQTRMLHKMGAVRPNPGPGPNVAIDELRANEVHDLTCDCDLREPPTYTLEVHVERRS